MAERPRGPGRRVLARFFSLRGCIPRSVFWSSLVLLSAGFLLLFTEDFERCGFTLEHVYDY